MQYGIVTNIQRFSTHDGPGIRTTVFLKGCNLRCFWCHNPETQRPKPELQVFLERCIGCGACLDLCPNGCHVLVDGERSFLRDRCEACGLCAENCFAQALVLVGDVMTTSQVVEEIRRDRAFYGSSGGGLTLSGGEPLMQRDFSYEILERCQAEGVHTAIETAAAWSWERIESVLPVTDMVMMDIKVMDAALHRQCTGVSNERILANSKRLGEGPRPLIVRTPVVPGVNDRPDDIAAIAEFISKLPSLLYYELLPFHPMGASKYESLDMDYRARNLERPSRTQMEALTEVAKGYGINARHR